MQDFDAFRSTGRTRRVHDVSRRITVDRDDGRSYRRSFDRRRLCANADEPKTVERTVFGWMQDDNMGERRIGDDKCQPFRRIAVIEGNEGRSALQNSEQDDRQFDGTIESDANARARRDASFMEERRELIRPSLEIGIRYDLRSIRKGDRKGHAPRDFSENGVYGEPSVIVHAFMLARMEPGRTAPHPGERLTPDRGLAPALGRR